MSIPLPPPGNAGQAERPVHAGRTQEGSAVSEHPELRGKILSIVFAMVGGEN